MTELKDYLLEGYWCSKCRRRYVSRLCKNGLPCGHDEAEPSRRQHAKNAMMQPATIIYASAKTTTHAKHGYYYYARFILRRVTFTQTGDTKVIENATEYFEVGGPKLVDLKLMFLDFLKSINSKYWVTFTHAFLNLIEGEASDKWVPKWRRREQFGEKAIT